MTKIQVFLTVLIIIENDEEVVENILSNTLETLRDLVSDYEIILVDNASSDNSLAKLKELTQDDGFPNLQIFALTKHVDDDVATWVGIENALGDFVVVLNTNDDEISVLPEMLERGVSGSDVVFARNLMAPKQKVAYRAANALFNFLYNKFSGVNLKHEAPGYRLMSRRVVNFILQHRQPAVSYRHLPVTAGFVKSYVEFECCVKRQRSKNVFDSVERGIRLMLSTTSAPMRLVTFLSLFGATANLFYSVYVLTVSFLAEDIEAGWASMSLQISGMFFLISIVMMILGEYILQINRNHNGGPEFHIGQEFNSSRITRMEKLNIEENKPS